MVVKRGNQREDRRPCIRRERHVADVDFVEWRLANAQYERPTLFESDIGSAFDEVRGGATGNAAKGADAARDYDHRVGRVRPAGDVGTDIAVGLLLNFCRRRADDLTYKV